MIDEWLCWEKTKPFGFLERVSNLLATSISNSLLFALEHQTEMALLLEQRLRQFLSQVAWTRVQAQAIGSTLRSQTRPYILLEAVMLLGCTLLHNTDQMSELGLLIKSQLQKDATSLYKHLNDFILLLEGFNPKLSTKIASRRNEFTCQLISQLQGLNQVALLQDYSYNFANGLMVAYLFHDCVSPMGISTTLQVLWQYSQNGAAYDFLRQIILELGRYCCAGALLSFNINVQDFAKKYIQFFNYQVLCSQLGPVSWHNRFQLICLVHSLRRPAETGHLGILGVIAKSLYLQHHISKQIILESYYSSIVELLLLNTQVRRKRSFVMLRLMMWTELEIQIDQAFINKYTNYLVRKKKSVTGHRNDSLQRLLRNKLRRYLKQSQHNLNILLKDASAAHD